jgi:uncharacterized membrane protein
MDGLDLSRYGATDLALLAVNALLAFVAVGIAIALRPWRCIGTQGPPWAWCLAWAAVTLLWAAVPEDGLLRPMTGVTLLVLMAGWPLAMLAMLGAAVLAATGGALSWPEALQRLVWMGVVPGICVLCIGAAVRRWLPPHLFAYILGRGYLGSFVASALAGALALGVAVQPALVPARDLLVAQLLIATAEASLCGTLVAILALTRPHWLATFSERLYRLP